MSKLFLVLIQICVSIMLARVDFFKQLSSVSSQRKAMFELRKGYYSSFQIFKSFSEEVGKPVFAGAIAC